jgi:hypothetical protein
MSLVVSGNDLNEDDDNAQDDDDAEDEGSTTETVSDIDKTVTATAITSTKASTIIKGLPY